MTINLEALEQAFAAVEEIGKGETTFDVGGTPITLRVILPTEETAVQEWASVELPNEDDSDEEAGASVFKFLDRFKLGTLSYAVVQMGDLDLRGVDFVPTGETLPNDKAVKVPRHEAVRKFVARWSSTIRDGVFKKYGEMVEEVGAKAEKAIEFKPSDFDGEIERLQARIKELHVQAEADKKGGFAEQVKQINEMGEAAPVAAVVSAAAEAAGMVTPPAEVTPAQPEPVPEPAPAASGPRRSSVPQQAAPPPKAPAVGPDAAKSAEPQKKKPQAPDESIVGSDNMEAAVEAENRRLLEMRMQGRQVDEEPSGSAIDAARAPQRRRPPHADAQDAAAEVEAMEPDARVKGQPAFRMDEPVGEVAAPPQQATAASINAPPQGKKNPRFRPPKP